MKEKEEKENETEDVYQQALDILNKFKGKFVSDKEYPMPNSYKIQTAQLLKLLEIREKIDEQCEFLTPEKRRGTNERSGELDKRIDDFEDKIAAQYEMYQLLRTMEDELSKIEARQMARIQEMYVSYKHRAPKEKFDELVELVNTLPPEEKENFLDQVAILEATRLGEILGDETE